MPDYLIAADLNSLEQLLAVLANQRDDGNFSTLQPQAYAAANTLVRLHQLSSDVHHRRIDYLATRYERFIHSIAH